MGRRIVQVESGVLRIEQRLRIPGLEIGTDVSGPACIYAVVRARRGTVAYQHGNTPVPAPPGFALFLPPFALVQAALERCDVTSVAVAFRPHASDELPRQAVLLAENGPVPDSQHDVLERIRTTPILATIGREVDPAPLALNAKTIIDQEYAVPLEIGRIAARLGASPAILSRTFRHAYGMPPVRYRHRVRVMEALMQFSDGAVPARVFQDVGFDDLSRFYKVFRTVTCAPPGSYRPLKSKTAKT